MLQGVRERVCICIGGSEERKKCVCVCVYVVGGGRERERGMKERMKGKERGKSVCSPLQQCLYSLVAVSCVHMRTDGHHTKTRNGV